MKIQNQTLEVQRFVALPDERETRHAYPDLTLESRLFEAQLTLYPMQHIIPDPVIAPQRNELAALGIEGGQP